MTISILDLAPPSGAKVYRSTDLVGTKEAVKATSGYRLGRCDGRNHGTQLDTQGPGIGNADVHYAGRNRVRYGPDHRLRDRSRYGRDYKPNLRRGCELGPHLGGEKCQPDPRPISG